MFSSLLSRLVLIVITAGTLAAATLFALGEPSTDIRLASSSITTTVNETFTTEIVVMSDVPVNVFQGELQFDHTKIQVDAINYNTSIADLWAESPWYDNGDGTLTFIGGTTKKGGFIGAGSLITITFKTTAQGEALLHMDNARILMHDGLGTDAILGVPIDTIVTVTEKEQIIIEKSVTGTAVTITETPIKTDLNKDGRQSAADISIFMFHLATQNKHSDFNDDGRVNTADLSIIMQ